MEQAPVIDPDMQKAYEQLMKRRAYSAEYMRKFRAERREEYNAQRRAMYAKKKAKDAVPCENNQN